MMEHAQLYIILACIFGLMMTWSVGANDLANIMSTTIGSKAVSVRQAIFIAVFLEFAGALWGTGNVTSTIRTGIINLPMFAHDPQSFILGMLSVLLAVTCWMVLASYFGLPVSITHATIGAIVGFGTILLGIHAIHWHIVMEIAISWIVSPALSCLAAYLIFRSVQTLILGKEDPDYYARRYVPVYLFIVGFILAIMIIFKGLTHFGFHLSREMKIIIALSTGLLVMIKGMIGFRFIKVDYENDGHGRFAYVEKLFSILMAFTACAMVFAHGSNDVAIGVGPMSAVISVAQSGKISSEMHTFNTWILIWGCTGVILGFLMYGTRVIATVGSSITALTPSRAFAATLAAAGTVIASTSIGIPVSATQTLVGGILGVGLARGIGALNLSMVRNIFMSWIVTIPTTSFFTILFFYAFKYCLG